MSLPDAIRAQLAELEQTQRRVGLVTPKLLREVLPKRIADQMSMQDLAVAAEQLNSLREDIVPVQNQTGMMRLELDVKQRQSGDAMG